MASEKLNTSKILPVFLTFIVMGFVDIVGVSTGYAQKDFELSDTLAQFIPTMVFIWFFIFSIPIGILQDKIGKRKMMIAGICLTLLGLILPFINYTFLMTLIAFIFIGIGNTIIQVSANPLLQEVTTEKKLSSNISLSQFIKAITSLLGPIIATYMALNYGDWRIVFLVYASVSLLSIIWLSATRIEERIKSDIPATFYSCINLLKDRFILTLVVAIFLIVGADVGMNSNIQVFLMNLHGLTLEEASYGISLYFTALMISRLGGAILLNYFKARFFLTITTVLALMGTILLLFSSSPTVALIAIFIIGLGAGNLFPLVFSIAINYLPTRVNEISSLLVMAIVGGAVIPPIMGAMNAIMGVIGGLIILLLCFAYIVIIPIPKKAG